MSEVDEVRKRAQKETREHSSSTGSCREWSAWLQALTGPSGKGFAQLSLAWVLLGSSFRCSAVARLLAAWSSRASGGSKLEIDEEMELD